MTENRPQSHVPRPNGAEQNGSLDTHEIVCPDAERALRWLTTLASRGIPGQLSKRNEQWVVDVPLERAAEAHREIDEYEYVNENWPPPGGNAKEPPVRPEAFFASALVISGLIAWYAWTGPAADQPYIYQNGAGDYSQIAAGEWWRLITSQTLHADFRHVFANAASLLLFGTAVCHFLGAGLGWCAVLATGVIGGAAGVWFSDLPQVVIGASNSAFGALGLLSVFQFARNFGKLHELGTIWHRSWAALAAAVALLALLGTAPGTHVAGHVLGFTAGLLLGFVILPFTRFRTPSGVQILLFAIFLLIITGAWQLALHS